MTAQNENSPIAAASFAELKSACVGADAEFLVAQMEAGATAAQASKAWMAEQGKRLESSEKARQEAVLAAEEAAKKATSPKLPGAKALTSKAPEAGAEDDESFSDDAKGQLEAIAAGKIKRGVPAHQAWRQACRENPQLRGAMVAQANAK